MKATRGSSGEEGGEGDQRGALMTSNSVDEELLQTPELCYHQSLQQSLWPKNLMPAHCRPARAEGDEHMPQPHLRGVAPKMVSHGERRFWCSPLGGEGTCQAARLSCMGNTGSRPQCKSLPYFQLVVSPPPIPKTLGLGSQQGE